MKVTKRLFRLLWFYKSEKPTIKITGFSSSCDTFFCSLFAIFTEERNLPTSKPFQNCLQKRWIMAHSCKGSEGSKKELMQKKSLEKNGSHWPERFRGTVKIFYARRDASQQQDLYKFYFWIFAKVMEESIINNYQQLSKKVTLVCLLLSTDSASLSNMVRGDWWYGIGWICKEWLCM